MRGHLIDLQRNALCKSRPVLRLFRRQLHPMTTEAALKANRGSTTMKIALLSDLHLSVQAMDVPATNADVVVLAGDLHRPAGAMEQARQFCQPTLFVAGNHGFDGGDLSTTMCELREHAQGTVVRVLDHEVWLHGGVRFLGCTLWSDNRLFDSPAPCK